MPQANRAHTSNSHARLDDDVPSMRSAFQRGARAGRKDEYGNPFPRGSAKSGEYLAGWYAVRRLVRDDEGGEGEQDGVAPAEDEYRAERFGHREYGTTRNSLR